MTEPYLLAFGPARQAFLDDVFALAQATGGEARLVGGVVRNALLANHHGLSFSADQDLDLAVSLPITRFAEAARDAGFSVYDTGLAHGTVTLRQQGQSAEITQLRTDTETDGRHARIRPTDSWAEDAKRRDFTINALYLDASGQLFDPVGGLADLQAWRLRFVGDPARRLREDHLRSLRALRFLATYPDLVMAEADRAAIAVHTHLLPNLSAERIASELNRLMAGPAARSVLLYAAELHLDHILFDAPFRTDALTHDAVASVWDALSFAARLSFCLPPGARASAGPRLRLSRSDSRYLEQADRPADPAVRDILLGEGWARSAYRLGPAAGLHALDHALDTGQTLTAARLRQIVFFRPPPCPVKGRDIVHHYRLDGPAVGLRLAALEQLWVDTDFTLSADQLLALYDKNKSITSS